MTSFKIKPRTDSAIALIKAMMCENIQFEILKCGELVVYYYLPHFIEFLEKYNFTKNDFE